MGEECNFYLKNIITVFLCKQLTIWETKWGKLQSLTKIYLEFMSKKCFVSTRLISCQIHYGLPIRPESPLTTKYKLVKEF
jgi:hypothetical protein